jgi:hypothetical protein
VDSTIIHGIFSACVSVTYIKRTFSNLMALSVKNIGVLADVNLRPRTASIFPKDANAGL